MPLRDVVEESGTWFTTAPATEVQRRLTLAAIVALLLIFVPVVVFSNVPLLQSDGFIPFIQGTMFVTELATAVLLYAQFAFVRSRAVLLLANGYLFTALIVVVHTVTFPRAFALGSLFGVGFQTTGWLHIIWHFVFPASAICYALLRNTTADTTGLKKSSAKLAIAWSIVIVCGLVFTLTWVLIAGEAHLPRLFLDPLTFAPLAAQLGVFDALVSMAAFLLLWRRQNSVLDRWLMIAVFATFLEMTMVVILTGRFTVGWYSVRVFGMVTSSVVLVALLTEAMVLHARLANSNVLLRRERANRLMSLDVATAAIAHEVRQPLAAIGAFSSAASNWLRKTPLNLDEVSACMSSITDNNKRANDIISSVRSLFNRRHDQTTTVYFNDVAHQVLALAQSDLEINRVSLSTHFQDGLPGISADRIQLQQVILNLVKNAIDAMNSNPSGARHLRLATARDGQSSILLSVQDSGGGIATEVREHIFQPFVTTKSAGMGLGLAISKTIVEEHGGELRIARSGSDGTVFEIVLPVAPNDDRNIHTDA